MEEAGHQVYIQDFNLPPHLPLETQVESVANFRPDLVGITSMSHVYYGARLLAQRIKAAIGCPVVMGGPHPSIFKEALLEEPSIDFVVYGEGEDTLVELAQALEGERSLDGIAGICWRRQKQPVQNPPRAAIANLDALPFPARHLLRLEDYPLRAPDGSLMATFITSRGCPYDCSFCYKGLFGRTYRQRSVANVIQEMKEVMQSYQIRNFYFIDDIFTLNQKWLNDFTQSIIREGLDIRWKCLARVDRVNPHVLRQMWQAGCREVHYGIESGDEGILRNISKSLSLSQVREAVASTRQAGMLVKGYFMLGLPEDTEETIHKTVDLAGKLGLDEAMFSLTTPFPGTRLWQDLAARNPQILQQDLSRAYYYNMNGKELLPFMNVSGVPDGRLTKLCREAARSFRCRQEQLWYQDRLGQRWGGILWRVLRVPGLSRVARALNRLGLLPPLPNERQFLVRRWA
jgi:radical SAM superfamily enzyme YgiQ (UPF0313 family)